MMLGRALATSRAALHRVTVSRHRLQLSQARHDRRDWQVKQRERTRHLIELGGLVMKAELVTLTDDDRAVILGLLIEAAAKLRDDDRERHLSLWRRRGRRVFETVALPPAD
ncbi:MAG: conjugal transfer protein TraD [Pseudomonadota bacterium]|nr:conjugal transfer protein TraD [Pseudomonadota bacterium]